MLQKEAEAQSYSTQLIINLKKQNKTNKKIACPRIGKWYHYL
jgi:hypothetical protein